MRAYHNLLLSIINEGNDRGDRTGTGTTSCFGLQFKHDLNRGFPLLTTKRMNFKAIVVELLWFLRGDTNIKYLLENGVHIWTADAYRMYCRKIREYNPHADIMDMKLFEHCILDNADFARAHGNLGPIYGSQWRAWNWKLHIDYDKREAKWVDPIDQIKNVIESIRTNPEGRRHIVTAWNPAEVDNMALPPCHCLFQFYVHDGKLSCHMYQRSADVFLGVPFNIASYALLTHIIAHQVGLGVGELIISFGDVHIYRNHIDQVLTQLERTPKDLPKLLISGIPQGDGSYKTQEVDRYDFVDFSLVGYDPHPAIRGELSVGV